MSAPKHLWSGDWRQESAAVSEELAGRRGMPRKPEAPPAPTPAARARPRVARARPRRARTAPRIPPRLKQVLPVALAVVLILAAGAYGLSQVLGGSDQPAAATVSQPSGPIDWLGMQIQSVTPGTVVIETVAPGSAGERAGLEPGDLIVAVNGKPISAPGDISAAISSVRLGAYVPIEVNRGSTAFTTQAALAGPPTSHP